MLFFCIFALMCLSNAVSLAPELDSLSLIMSNPEQLIQDMQNLSPEKLQKVITMLRELKESSIAEETDFVDDLNTKVAALDEANGRVIQKEKDLKAANDAVTAAGNALTAAQTVATVANTALTAERAVQETSQSEKDASQGLHDKHVPSLDNEQQVLTEVIAALSGLPDAGVSLQKDELALQKNHLITTLPKLTKGFVVSFDVQANRYVNEWQNIVHFSPADSDGSRQPAVWFNHLSGSLHICSAINDNSNNCYNSPAIATGIWTTVRISQTAEGAYSIALNGEEVFVVQNNNAQEYSDVKVYASNPWYVPLDGSIRDFHLTLSED